VNVWDSGCIFYPYSAEIAPTVLSYSLDGTRWLVASSYSHKLVVWDSSDYPMENPFYAHTALEGGTHDAVWSRSGLFIVQAVASRRSILAIHDLASSGVHHFRMQREVLEIQRASDIDEDAFFVRLKDIEGVTLIEVLYDTAKGSLGMRAVEVHTIAAIATERVRRPLFADQDVTQVSLNLSTTSRSTTDRSCDAGHDVGGVVTRMRYLHRRLVLAFDSGHIGIFSVWSGREPSAMRVRLLGVFIADGNLIEMWPNARSGGLLAHVQHDSRVHFTPMYYRRDPIE
jgi:hypothetical protein